MSDDEKERSEGAKSDDKTFDETVGALEDVIMSDEFRYVQSKFMEKHYRHFEEGEENKHIYHEIFKKQGETIEQYLSEALSKRIAGFSMDEFTAQLKHREDQVPPEIAELLMSLIDFAEFKEAFLVYKADREGTTPDLSGLLVTSSANGRVNEDEDDIIG